MIYPDIIQNIPYPALDGGPSHPRCLMDRHGGAPGGPSLVWFHGGGLEGGEKDSEETRCVCQGLSKLGIHVFSVNYRLSPTFTYPAYVDDCVSAIRTVRKNLPPGCTRLFVGGHSAGAYLALMATMDLKRVGTFDGKAVEPSGVVAISGQCLTHFTVRKERGLPNPGLRPWLDESAPLWHIRADAPPLLLMWGEMDLPSRAEENLLLVALQKAAGHQKVVGKQIANRDHTGIITQMHLPGDPVAIEVFNFLTATESTP